MKLLFDKTTRRMAGTIEGSRKGLSANLVTVVSPMPSIPETAYLNADNATVSVKALTTAESEARAAGPGGGVSLPPPVLTRVEFIDRFTDTEQVAIFTAAASNVAMQIFIEKWRAATEIGLGDARVIAGVEAMEAATLIGTGRAAEILK